MYCRADNSLSSICHCNKLFYFDVNLLREVFELLLVLWPLTGKPFNFLSPRYDLMRTKRVCVALRIRVSSVLIVISELRTKWVNLRDCWCVRSLIFRLRQKPNLWVMTSARNWPIPEIRFNAITTVVFSGKSVSSIYIKWFLYCLRVAEKMHCPLRFNTVGLNF